MKQRFHSNKAAFKLGSWNNQFEWFQLVQKEDIIDIIHYSLVGFNGCKDMYCNTVMNCTFTGAYWESSIQFNLISLFEKYWESYNRMDSYIFRISSIITLIHAYSYCSQTKIVIFYGFLCFDFEWFSEFCRQKNKFW